MQSPQQAAALLNVANNPGLAAGQRVALPLPAGTSVARGWHLLRARLHCQGRRGQTWLFWLDSAGTEQRVRLPVSRKGTLLELVDLGAGAVQLWLLPMTGEGTCCIEDLSLQPQPWQMRQLRRWQRVWPMYRKLSPMVRTSLGLVWPLLLTDLPQAYRLVGEIRDDVPETDYPRWRLRHSSISPAARARMRRIAHGWKNTPRFTVCIQAVTGADASATHDSLSGQLYQAFDVQDAPAHDNSQGWCVCVPAGVVLAEHALFCMASAIRNQPHVRAIYADHDLISDLGEPLRACFKPDWSPAMALCGFYTGPLLALRNDVLAGEADPYAALLRLLPPQASDQVHHIPRVLAHVPESLSWRQPEDERGALARATGMPVESGMAGYWRVRHALPATLPLISVIVPTRDALPILQACVESVLGRSTYPALELLVVDNNSQEAETLIYLRELATRPQVRVLPYAAPFNYSAINNFAVREARGQFVCLLNNDTEVITPGWLEEMLAQLLQPQVGVVGAKLYFSDGRIQHAGDAVGPGGCADHYFSGLAGDDPGYMHRAMLVQDLSAVTAACLLTRRSLYLELGGLDEQNLPVAFNDVDYCLRVRMAGRRVVWTPYAQLYHHESLSRGKDESPENKARAERELSYMRQRWQKQLLHDPFYNPNLSYERPDFSLSKLPCVPQLW